MRKLFFLTVVLFIANVAIAQEGAPLLTHFKESREIENQNWAICQDKNNVMLFANRKGILTFDGQEWLSVRIPAIPYSMINDPSGNKIYVGGENSYGFLIKDFLGEYKYYSLSVDSSEIGVITKIIIRDPDIWFYGSQTISRHNLSDGKLTLRLKAKDENPFSGIITTPDKVFINKAGKGLYRIESDTLFPIVTGYLTENTDILFSLPYNQSLVLVGLSDGKLSLFDGIKYNDYPIKDEGYLLDNVLSEGLAIGDSLYAFSTLDGGALVVDKLSGRIRHTINNQNELPDDEVFALGLDKSGGLWLSHQYGLTRADLNLPVGNFSIYPGLKGNLTTSLWHNNELYVATSEGVYYLTEVKNYSEVQVFVKNEATGPVTKSSQDAASQPSGRKNIFTKIFGKKITKEQTTVAPQQKPVVAQYTKKTVSKLKSINYVFKKIEGFDEKCRQLVSTPNGILAASNKGLFVISNHRATLINADRYINFISWKPETGRYLIAAGDGYFTCSYSNGKWISSYPDPSFTDPVYSYFVKDKTIWLGIDNAVLRFNPEAGTGSPNYERISIKNDFPQRYILDLVNDSVLLYTETGIWVYDDNSRDFIKSKRFKYQDERVRYIYPLSNLPWVKAGENWIFMNSVGDQERKEISLLKVFSDVVSVDVVNGNMWVVDGANRLFKVDLNKPTRINPEIDVFVKSVYNEDGKEFSLSDIEFNRGDNIVNFDIVAPAYLKQNTTQYQYTINKLMPEWSPWSERTKYNLMVPVPGNYTLQIRAKDLWGNIGEPVSVKFTIKAPFTETPVFFILAGSLILLILFVIVRFREGQLHKENRILEEKVRERTTEIAAQKEEITSSIEYASRIQMAMLPEEVHFNSLFAEHFIIFKPRDIVSGDFYWVGENEKHIFFTVADCTGHGVPGAFMSTLGISTLNEIITNNSELKANTVLSLLREKIKTSLHQTGKEGEAADGMDVAFCILHKDRKTLEYSGAYNPLFIQQGEEIKEYKADRMPIGIYYGKKEGFTNYEINVKKGDIIYIFSDGFADQFGGQYGSKYKKANLKKLLCDIYYKPMDEQKNIILKEFEKWRGSLDQVDDITIMGVRV
jgi:serine phosphatase RsbU (regulator of sigma subunit)